MVSLILRRESGFTLLEVVFASAILAIGIMGYTKIKTSSRYSRIYSKELSQSIQLSGSQMEDFILRGYNNSLLDATAGTAVHPYSEIGTLAVGDFSFADADWTVREKCPSELSKLIQFTGYWGPTNNKDLQLTQVQVRP